MAGVVKMQHSSLAFGDDDLRRLKNRLDDTNTSDKERMDILRTLDSMVIGLDRLRASGIGKTISRLAKQPSNLQQLARRLKGAQRRWRRFSYALLPASNSRTRQLARPCPRKCPQKLHQKLCIETFRAHGCCPQTSGDALCSAAPPCFPRGPNWRAGSRRRSRPASSATSG